MVMSEFLTDTLALMKNDVLMMTTLAAVVKEKAEKVDAEAPKSEKAWNYLKKTRKLHRDYAIFLKVLREKILQNMDEEDRGNPEHPRTKLLATEVEQAFHQVMEDETYQDYVGLRAVGFERDMRKLTNDMVGLCKNMGCGQQAYWRQGLDEAASWSVISLLAADTIYTLSPELRKMPEAFLAVPGAD